MAAATGTGRTYTATTVTIDGVTYPASYKISDVRGWVAINSEPLNVWMHDGNPDYAAVLAAAEEAARIAAEQADADPETETEADAEAISDPEPETEPDPEPVAEPERDPKAARGPVPQKTFVGTSIDGVGWRIVFDASSNRTRVVFDGTPSETQRQAVEAAGFWWSARQRSYNKKLTWKAYRAAVALSGQLSSIAAG